jgi:hypothetical protein
MSEVDEEKQRTLSESMKEGKKVWKCDLFTLPDRTSPWWWWKKERNASTAESDVKVWKCKKCQYWSVRNSKKCHQKYSKRKVSVSHHVLCGHVAACWIFLKGRRAEYQVQIRAEVPNFEKKKTDSTKSGGRNVYGQDCIDTVRITRLWFDMVAIDTVRIATSADLAIDTVRVPRIRNRYG